MADRVLYQVRPLEHIYDMSRPPLNMPFLAADWPCMNILLDNNRITKRWGYKAVVDLGDGNVQILARFKTEDDVENALFLTEADLCKRETASGKTFSYKTETGTYDGTTQVDSIDAGTKLIVTFEAGTTLQTDGVAAGDMFVLSEDLTSDVEVDASWREIDGVDSETQLTLMAAYQKAVTSPGAKDAYVRKVYTVPSGERWAWCNVSDRFIFTNGNVDVQTYNGSGYASALDSTNAKKARYCLPYAQRLLIADVEVSSTREPWTLQWSKSTDPTDWTDSTAGSVDFVTTDGFITGLGQVGNNVCVYKEDSIIFGYRTGIATSPFTFPTEKRGIGNYAPYSLVHFLGTNAFIGRDDFYFIDGDHPKPIGDAVRKKFFDIVSDSDLKNVWGTSLSSSNEIIWKAVTTEGIYWFVWNWKYRSWTTYDFYHDVQGIGEV